MSLNTVDPCDEYQGERNKQPWICETLGEFINRTICVRFTHSSGEWLSLNFDGQVNSSFYEEPTIVLSPEDFLPRRRPYKAECSR